MSDRFQPNTTVNVERYHLDIDVSHAVHEVDQHTLSAQVALPAGRDAITPRVVLCCLPGGFLSKAYFDLEIDDSYEFSFVDYMARQGFATLCLDHLGTGDSSRPKDGYALGVDAIARANQAALETLLQRLRVGDGLPALPELVSVGVGHSMGSCLSVVQQALHAPHSALVLFSFTTAGLPDFLGEAELELANNPTRAHAEALLGAGQDMHSVFGVIMGTGVGGGMVIGKTLHTGLQHIAGEWGHNSLNPDGPPCYCGQRGCIETYLSGPGFLADYQQLGGVSAKTPEAVVSQADAQDPAAEQALENLLEHFGRALAGVINILDPHVIVLGGGLSNIGQLYEYGPGHIEKYVFNPVLQTPLRRNVNGDSAGVLGAARLWDA